MGNDLVPRAGKDSRGRFLAGNKWSPGRKVGSKGKLSENFLTTLAADFKKNGQAVIERVRQEAPETYLRVVAGLVPKELLQRLEVRGEIDFSTRATQILNAYHLLGEEIDAEDMKTIEAIPNE